MTHPFSLHRRRFLSRFLWLLRLTLACLILAACTPTASPPPLPTASPPPPPTPSPPPATITLYFTDLNLFATGTPPFEVAVMREVPGDADLPRAVLDAYFAGPTEAEQARGLSVVTSGFTGASRLEIGPDGVARVFLEGACAATGAAYTIADPLILSLLQLEAIRAVKLYDETGDTMEPDGAANSVPACLQP